jgi:TonB family protein
MKLGRCMLVLALGGCASAGPRASSAPGPDQMAPALANQVKCDGEVRKWPMVRREVKLLPPNEPLASHEVKLAVSVSPEGRVTAVQVIESAGPPYDDTAKGAMKQFLFEPGRGVDDRPLACTITYRYLFAGVRH